MRAKNLHLSFDVVNTVRTRWPARGQQWSEHVENELSHLCMRYSATPVATLQSRFSLVVAVVTNSQHHLVMRSTPDPQGGFQATVCKELARLRVGPWVYEAIETATGIWMVMDRIQSGLTLVNRAASLEELAEVLRPIVNQPAPQQDMPSVVDWLASRLDNDQLRDRAPGRDIAPLAERERAAALLKDLAQDWSPSLCHGDVSSKNVLTPSEGGLRLIDPRGVRGEAAYDVSVVASKLARRYGTADGTADLADLADLVGVDRDRALAWRTVATAARV